jgi:hypothetical protein
MYQSGAKITVKKALEAVASANATIINLLVNELQSWTEITLSLDADT